MRVFSIIFSILSFLVVGALCAGFSLPMGFNTTPTLTFLPSYFSFIIGFFQAGVIPWNSLILFILLTVGSILGLMTMIFTCSVRSKKGSALFFSLLMIGICGASIYFAYSFYNEILEFYQGDVEYQFLGSLCKYGCIALLVSTFLYLVSFMFMCFYQTKPSKLKNYYEVPFDEPKGCYDASY